MTLFKARLVAATLGVSALCLGAYSFYDFKSLTTQQQSSRLDHVFLSFPNRRPKQQISLVKGVGFFSLGRSELLLAPMLPTSLLARNL